MNSHCIFFLLSNISLTSFFLPILKFQGNLNHYVDLPGLAKVTFLRAKLFSTAMVFNANFGLILSFEATVLHVENCGNLINFDLINHADRHLPFTFLRSSLLLSNVKIKLHNYSRASFVKLAMYLMQEFSNIFIFLNYKLVSNTSENLDISETYC